MDTTPPLRAAPRTVPGSLALRVLLGGVGAAISWSLLAFGGLIAGMFVSNSSLLTSWRFDGTLAGTHGEVVAVEPTSSRVNGVAVLRVRFEFEAPDGPRQSSSYGTTFAGRVADVVEVEWPEGHADLARIVGMRTRAFSGWVGLTLLVPFAGLVGLLISLRANTRRLRLMRYGSSAWGVLTDKTRTNTQINGCYVYRLTFEFLDETGTRRTATDRTHHAEFFDRDVARQVLYDVATGHSCLVGLSPGKPAIADGAWVPAGGRGVVKVLLLPTVAATVLATAPMVQL